MADRECRNCRHFAPLLTGHAAICLFRWRRLPWNAAVPLTTAHETCDDFDPVAQSDRAPGSEAGGERFESSRGRHD